VPVHPPFSFPAGAECTLRRRLFFENDAPIEKAAGFVVNKGLIFKS
jgi:hypothetical protein